MFDATWFERLTMTVMGIVLFTVFYGLVGVLVLKAGVSLVHLLSL